MRFVKKYERNKKTRMNSMKNKGKIMKTISKISKAIAIHHKQVQGHMSCRQPSPKKRNKYQSQAVQ